MAARSANKAADTQARAAQDALAWEKQQHAAEQQRLSPYRQMGHGAMHQLSSMLGVPGPQFEQPQPFTAGKTLAAMRGGLAQVREAGGAKNVIAAAAPQFVTVQAPSGETRQMPMDQAQRFVAKGARIVPQGGASPRGGRSLQEMV
jgi:hypothetical protein